MPVLPLLQAALFPQVPSPHKAASGGALLLAWVSSEEMGVKAFP